MTHDEELVEIVTAVASILADRFSDSEDWCDAVAVDVVHAIEPLITRKAKEELLKQMMGPSEIFEKAIRAHDDCTGPTCSDDVRAFLRTFATEQGLSIEGVSDNADTTSV